MTDVLRRQKGVVLLIGLSYLFFYTTFDLAHYTFHSQFGSASCPMFKDESLVRLAFAPEKKERVIIFPPTDEQLVDCPFALLMNNLSSNTGISYYSISELALISLLKPKEKKPLPEIANFSFIPRAPPAFSFL